MRWIPLLLTTVVALAAFSRDLSGCPLCVPAGLTLAEQLAQADVSVLVRWVESQPPTKDQGFAGATTYEVVEVLSDAGDAYKAGARIVINKERAARPGDLFILLGVGETDVLWDVPRAVSEASYQYIRQAPSKETDPTERLPYFVRFLESSDQLVSDDAYGELATAPYKDIVAIRDSLPRAKLREWVSNPETSKMRIGLYGLMLGLCGDSDDAELLRGIVEQPADGLRLGIDGIMGGYVLLTGEAGLEVIDAKLHSADQEFSEAFSAIQVLRFLWTYAPERVPADRLRASMRTVLARSDMADLAITDLARWEDWSSIDRVIEMYEQPEFAAADTRRNIVRFCLVAERAARASDGEPMPETALKAQQFIAHVAESNPKLLENAKRWFPVN